MAVYKVIQDIEADDKLVGPFGIKQFIYLLIVAFLLFITYQVGSVSILLALPFLPMIVFFGLLALPLGGAQPTDIWLLAKFRFLLKSHKHVWSQDGVKNLVTITAPKQAEKHLTKELSPTEVRSRLEALAETIDSRGWAIKNVDANLFAQPAFAAIGASDRLLNGGGVAVQPPVINDGSTAGDDMLDTKNNPAAQKLNNLIQASSKTRREQLAQQIKQNAAKAALEPTAPASQPAAQPVQPIAAPQRKAPPSPPGGAIVHPETGSIQQQNQPVSRQPKQSGQLSEEELLAKIHAEQNKPKNYGHLHVVQPLSEQTKQNPAQKPSASAKPAAPPAMTRQPDPDIIELAGNNDLNVETIARQVNKKKQKDQPPPGEVVIKLH